MGGVMTFHNEYREVHITPQSPCSQMDRAVELMLSFYPSTL